MITYKPITDIDRIFEIYKDFTFDNQLKYAVYCGYEDDGTAVGSCLFSIDGYNCYINSIDCDYEDKILVEGYIRAALNFCANRNAYMAHCNIEDVSSVLQVLGFEKNNNLFSGDIPSLLKGSCCK